MTRVTQQKHSRSDRQPPGGDTTEEKADLLRMMALASARLCRAASDRTWTQWKKGPLFRFRATQSRFAARSRLRHPDRPRNWERKGNIWRY
jgi:hypothetical protein